MLQQHPLLLRNAQRLRDFRRLLGPHHKMAQKLPRRGVVRGQSQLRELELPGLGEIVGEGPGQQQAPVDDLGVEPRQEVRDLQHIPRVHQKPHPEAVVHALGGGDEGEVLPVPPQQLLRRRPVVRILDGGQVPPHLRHGRVLRNGRLRYQGRRVHRVPLRRQADAVHRDLHAAPVLAHIAPDLHDLALVRPADGPGVVPDLALHGPGPVRQGQDQKGLPGAGDLALGRAQQVKALNGVTDGQVRNCFVILHLHSSSRSLTSSMRSSSSSWASAQVS